MSKWILVCLFSLIGLHSLAQEGENNAENKCEEKAQKARENFEFSAFLSYIYDNFSVQQDAPTQGTNGQTQAETDNQQLGAGFDFAYRLYGSVDEKSKQQLWVFGEMLYGMRSAETATSTETETGNSKRPKMEEFDPSKQTLAIISGAETLEALGGFRWEFNRLDTGVRLYLKAQLGFISFADDFTVTSNENTNSDAGDGDTNQDDDNAISEPVTINSDVYDNHHLGIGIIIDNGHFKNSFLEAGWGKSDFFETKPDDRWKVEAYLTWCLESGFNPFIHIDLDTDGGNGSDSITTYVGVNFDLSKMKISFK